MIGIILGWFHSELSGAGVRTVMRNASTACSVRMARMRSLVSLLQFLGLWLLERAGFWFTGVGGAVKFGQRNV